jgi:hypothetical protein
MKQKSLEMGSLRDTYADIYEYVYMYIYIDNSMISIQILKSVCVGRRPNRPVKFMVASEE